MSVFGVFLIRIFLHSDWIRRDNPRIQSECRKNGPEKLRIFTQWLISLILLVNCLNQTYSLDCSYIECIFNRQSSSCSTMLCSKFLLLIFRTNKGSNKNTNKRWISISLYIYITLQIVVEKYNNTWMINK